MVFNINKSASKMSNKFETLKHHVDEDSGSGDEDTGPNITDLGPIDYPPGEHRLQHPYCLWFSKRPQQIQGLQGYSQALRLVGQVGTVEQWWSLYSHMVRLQDIPAHRDIHLFKKGIKPMWEDAANKKGGKWVIRLRKEQAGRAWENLCMAMLGEQFMDKICPNVNALVIETHNKLDSYDTRSVALEMTEGGLCFTVDTTGYVVIMMKLLSKGRKQAGNEICGVVVSTRYQEYLLSIWNRTASDQATTARIRDALKRLLNIPSGATMEYKTHNDCLKYGATKTIPNNLLKS